MDTKPSRASKGANHSLRGKRVLITAGPTWVAIDNVRVISNTASGQTGFLLAKGALRRGCKVTLALGPVEKGLALKNIRIKPYRYFNELLSLIKKEAASGRYDIVIHSAAVSDYRPARPRKSKIKSGIKNLVIRLKPNLKIVNLIKKIAPKVFLVIFKLEGDTTGTALINRAKKALLQSRADMAVANMATPEYKAFILDRNKIYARANSKELLANKLLDAISLAYPP